MYVNRCYHPTVKDSIYVLEESHVPVKYRMTGNKPNAKCFAHSGFVDLYFLYEKPDIDLAYEAIPLVEWESGKITSKTPRLLFKNDNWLHIDDYLEVDKKYV